MIYLRINYRVFVTVIYRVENFALGCFQIQVGLVQHSEGVVHNCPIYSASARRDAHSQFLILTQTTNVHRLRLHGLGLHHRVAPLDDKNGVHELLISERLRNDRIGTALLEEGQVRRQRIACHADDCTGELQIPSHDLHGLRTVHGGHDAVYQNKVEVCVTLNGLHRRVAVIRLFNSHLA